MLIIYVTRLSLLCRYCQKHYNELKLEDKDVCICDIINIYFFGLFRILYLIPMFLINFVSNDFLVIVLVH